MTKLHPGVPRGFVNYAAMRPSPHQSICGIGADRDELMPVHYFLNDRSCRRDCAITGGYNTLGFSRRTTYASNPALRRMSSANSKQMVKDLHTAGFEVILDVVYNHTAEATSRSDAVLPVSTIWPTTAWLTAIAALHGFHRCAIR